MSSLSEGRKRLDHLENVTREFKSIISTKQGDYADAKRVDNPLGAFKDIASLLHAQTIKLGIAMKPPITPAAIVKVVDEITKLVPNFAAAYMGMTDQHDTKLMRVESRIRLNHLFTEVLTLSENLNQTLEKYESSEPKEGEKTDEVVLACISKVLNQSDVMKELASKGASGIAAEKLESYENMISDATSEFKSWIEDPNELDFDDFGDESEEEESSPANGDARNEDTGSKEEVDKFSKLWEDRLVKLQYLVKAVRNRRVKLLDVSILDKLVSNVDSLCASIDDLIAGAQLGEELQTLQETGDEIVNHAKETLVTAHIEMETPDQYVKWTELFKKSFFLE